MKKYKAHVYSVYMMAGISRVLYIGITNDLPRRVWEHKRDLVEGFSSKYKCPSSYMLNHISGFKKPLFVKSS